jgi:predicted negative regulator of RcsB-dependent stress response
MSAQSMAPRKRHASNVDVDDVVLARALRFSAWARANVTAIIVALVLVALAVGYAFYYHYHSVQRKTDAATAFVKLDATVSSGNTALAARDLGTFIQHYDGTVYAEQARIELAQIQMEAGKPKEAVTALQGADQRIDDSPVGAQAALVLAAAQAASGDRAGAIQTYLKVADDADLDFRKIDALNNAADLQEQAGDYEAAAALYQRLVGMTEKGTPENSLYGMRAAEATAKARAK